MAPEADGDGNDGSSTMEAEQNKKPRKRKKFRSSHSAAKSSASSSLPGDGDGSGGAGQQRQLLAGEGQKQQQLHRGKPRVIWTPELHNKFLKAYNTLGEDAVPKKILALMNVDWISRQSVASHLQKHRLSLKREEQLMMPGKVNPRPRLPLHVEDSPPTPTHVPSLHPPAQAPASSSLHPLPPPQASFAALTMPPQQIGHGHQHHLLQTPPDYCFSSSSNNAAPTRSLLHPHPCFIPMVQPIQQLFTLPLDMEATAVATRRKLFEKQQFEGRAAAAAAASGYNNLMLVRNDDVAQASQSVSMTRENTVPEANVRYEVAAEIRMDHLQMAAEGAAEETAAKAGEGQVQAAEPRTAAAGSSSPHGSSIHEQYWKIDDDITDVSWDFCGIPWRKTS